MSWRYQDGPNYEKGHHKTDWKYEKSLEGEVSWGIGQKLEQPGTSDDAQIRTECTVKCRYRQDEHHVQNREHQHHDGHEKDNWNVLR